MKLHIFRSPSKSVALLTAVVLTAFSSVHAQELVKADPSTAELSKMKPEQIQKVLGENPPLFLKVMSAQFKWSEPAEPAGIVGNIYFVGTKGLCCWLIKTSDGFILLNTAMPGSGPMIVESMKKLGFNPQDIKLVLSGHAHCDHVGGHAYIKKVSGAHVAVLDADKELLESGGKTDFFYGAYPEFLFESVNADRVIKDGEVVTLGDVSLTAHHTPGHTQGATTWTMKVTDGEKSYNVVFPDGSGVNPGYRVEVNPSYPGIGDDYRRTFKILSGLTPDISLGSHTSMGNFQEKLARAKTEGVAAWVDPAGYAKSVADAQAAFEATVKAETTAAGPKN